MYPPIDVDTGSYESASNLFFDTNNQACDTVCDASTGADAGGGMAGCDSSGVEWAQSYDQAAADAIKAGCQLVETLGNVGTLLSATGQNHAGADESSTTGQGAPTYPGSGPTGPAGRSGETLVASAPPSANGTPGDEPHGWFLIAHLMSWVWPNGHQDTLRQVGSAWKTAGTGLTNESYILDSAIVQVGEQKSPEVAQATKSCNDIQTAMQDLGTAYNGIGDACNDYAGHLDQAHHDVIEELKSLVEWTVGIEAGGAVLAFFSAGISEAAAQAAEAARCAATALRVGNILSKLAELTRAVVETIKGFVTTIADVLKTVGKFVGDGVKAALKQVGEFAEKRLQKQFAKLFEGRTPTATELKEFAEKQGWKPQQTATGPLKYVDENGVPRITIKEGSARTPGSENPHVELRNANGDRVDPNGNPVTRKSPGNHTPIKLN